MISIRSSADLARALNGCLEPHLRTLLTLRRDQLIGDDDEDLGELAHFIVVRNDDTLAAVEAERSNRDSGLNHSIGVSIAHLENRRTPDSLRRVPAY